MVLEVVILSLSKDLADVARWILTSIRSEGPSTPLGMTTEGTAKKMKNAFQLFAAFLLGSCASVPDNPNAELVMTPGTTVEASTSQGTMRISYVDRYTRRYVWDGYDKMFRHQPRQERWNGSLGMYRPQGDGPMHVVLEEGQQHFSSVDDARVWLAKKEKFMDHVWTRDGLAVGWKQQARPGDGYLALHVNVWQILINRKKPDLPGASPSKIRLKTAP